MTSITIDPSRSAGRFNHFWRASGFSPGQLLLEPEMRATLALVGATPGHGVEFLRPHYMLELVRATRTGHSLSYDWSLLDRAVDTMVEFGFRPFFELMGNPSGVFAGFTERNDILVWRDFVAELVRRFFERYGAEEVSKWYFETWNEPDLAWWKHGEDGFTNYYDACVAGIDAVDPTLRIGGPGTARTLSNMFKAFVAHCDSGTSCLTNDGPPRVDFISIHEKGVRMHLEDLTPDTVGICRREMLAVDYIRQHHPRLRNVPIINNECDPQVGWHDTHSWNATSYTPALMAKIIDQHQRLMIDEEKVPYDLLANDNGFLGTWGHRTQLTYFGPKSYTKAQSEWITDLSGLDAAQNVPLAFVKKPSLAIMELLGLLGQERLAVNADPILAPDDNGLGVIATRHDDGRLAVLIYNSVDAIRRSGETPIKLSLGKADGQYDYTVYQLAGDAAFAVWERLGAPASPTDEQLAQMRAAAEPVAIQSGVLESDLQLDLSIPLPSANLVLIEKRQQKASDAPVILSSERYTTPAGGTEMLLRWSSPASATAFTVSLSERREGPFQPHYQTLLAKAAIVPVDTKIKFATVTALTLSGQASEPALVEL
ncbi:L-iduronidase [Rhizobium sp. BK313]|uniref:GH39 family glycosyl hydrolase n=1 Tax=Rhizobium sp. BK313 TaxID=2587081 RepID=UPI00160ACC57|nr:glycosyl hydrolase [Rhizobium sp. BK313]MBB3456381.1 L-iduronidase [Rhizobium sp. BK313]